MTGVLVTRPEAQAAALVAQLRERDYHVIALPTIAIECLNVSSQCASFVDADWWIFTSQNAVTCLGDALPQHWQSFARKPRVAAIGPATAAALKSQGIKVDIIPSAQDMNSEGLLAQAEFQTPDGLRMVICRGEGGRTILADTLHARGATVLPLISYRRTCPHLPDSFRLNPAEIDLIVTTSVESLLNLFNMLGQSAANWLRDKHYIVVSERGAQTAKELGINTTPIVATANQQTLLEAIEQWAQQH